MGLEISGLGNQGYTPQITSEKIQERPVQSQNLKSNNKSNNSSNTQNNVSPKQDSESPAVTVENDEYKSSGNKSEDALIDAINQANEKLKGSSTEFQFSIHEKTKQITVKIMNTDTKEVIRELPPEKILDMVAKMWEMAGILVDEKR